MPVRRKCKYAAERPERPMDICAAEEEVRREDPVDEESSIDRSSDTETKGRVDSLIGDSCEFDVGEEGFRKVMSKPDGFEFIVQVFHGGVKRDCPGCWVAGSWRTPVIEFYVGRRETKIKNKLGVCDRRGIVT